MNADVVKDELLDAQCVQNEEYVTEEAIVYEHEFEEVKEEQIVEEYKEEEVEEEVEEEQEEVDVEEELEEEIDDSDEKEMVVDENDKDHSEESGDDSSNESDEQSDHSSNCKPGEQTNEDLYDRNESLEASNSDENRANSSNLMTMSPTVSQFDDRDGKISHPNDSWAHFTGLKVKHFTPSELEAFKKPFEMGWRREVVLRGTVTNSGKKIGDVYYFSPDKKVKLRSYVEMGLYLKKHQNCDLEPENFTFARQPIYKAPEEIVRYAMQRGGSHGGYVASLVDSSVVPGNANAPSMIHTSSHSSARSSARSVTSANSDSGNEDKPLGPLTPAQEGRFHSKTPHIKVTLANKSSLLAHPSIIPRKGQSHGQTILQMQPQPSQHLVVTGMQQLSNLHHEHRQAALQKHNLIQQTLAQQSQTSNEQQSVSNSNDTQHNSQHLSVQPVSARKSISGSSASKVPVLRIKMANFKPIKPKPSEQDEFQVAADTNGNIEPDIIPPQQATGQNTAPCSIMCNGRRGVLPNLLCSRCLCLFHPECVPTGIYLREPHQFVCPPTDKENQVGSNTSATVNGTTSGDGDTLIHAETLSKLAQNKTSLSPVVNSSQSGNPPPGIFPTHKSGRPYPPILPKPNGQTTQQVPSQQNQLHSQLQLIQHFQQQQRSHKQQLQQDQREQEVRKHQKPFSCSDVNVKLPAGTQLYRVPGPSHPVANKHFDNARSNAVPNSISALRDNVKSARKSVSRSAHFPSQTQVSTSLLQSLNYQPPPIAPIAPIKITPSQVASFLQRQKPRKEYKEYLMRHTSCISKLLSGYSCLNEIMKYMTLRDLIKLKQVNRLFNNLASQPFLWQKISLKGIKIIDWSYFGRNIVEPCGTTEIDFENIRCSPNSDLCDTWRNFSSIIDYLRSVKHLKFGSIPTFVIEELLNAAVTENCYNSFSALETLIVKNIFEEESKSSQCRLEFLEHIGFLPQLQTLHLECKQGFAGNESSAELLNEAFATLPGLVTLIIPCIKGFGVEQFLFLTKLKNLEHLEIGSCESWTTFEEEENDASASETQASKTNSGEENSAKEVAELKGAFKYLSELTKLRKLKLVDVIIDETSNQLSLALQKMSNLTSLSLDCVTISPDATETLNFLCTTIKSHLHDLKNFAISTDDPHTNKCVFDLLKKLENLSKITWKVGALVEDSGECLVPFLKERGDESEMEGENVDLTNGDDHLEMMDMTSLNEMLQVELPNTQVTIEPQ
ncbi:ras-related protein Rab-1A-like protein [Dinothrombium tinctorium]|uniref:Ras-related protein Rab-1A-like protein n=1 Tax=Dinothrombium tinctorium TaxID=1965070 RepID=A0A3S3S609_9ACAR|nr:ras-related protein Rab-1A-like protein [Dinothrombium tinctorium]